MLFYLFIYALKTQDWACRPFVQTVKPVLIYGPHQNGPLKPLNPKKNPMPL